MTEEGYRAGGAYIDITASFRGLLRDIERQATVSGDEFARTWKATVERGTGRLSVGPSDSASAREGAKSGGAFAATWRRQVDAALKDLPDAKVDADARPAERKIAEIRAELQQLSGFNIGVDISDKAAQAKIGGLRRELGRLKRDGSMSVRVDTAAASAKLEVLQRQMDRLNRSSGIGGVGRRLGSGLFGQGGFFGQSRGPGLLGSAVTFGLPLVGPAAGLLAGGAAALATPLAAGLGGLVPFAAAARSSLKPLAKDIQQLTKDQQAYNNATTSKQRQAALVKEHDLLKSLSGPQRDALKGVQGVEGAWLHFQKQLQPTIFKDLGDAGPLVARGLHLIEPVANAAGKALGDLETHATAALHDPFWVQFTHFLAGETGPAINALGTSLGRVATGAAHLLIAFAPLGHELEADMLKWSGQFEQWTQGQGPGRFVAWVQANGPKAAHELDQLARGVGGIFKALTPVGTLELHALADVTNWIDDISTAHPAVIRDLGVAILGLVVALKAGRGIAVTVGALSALAKVLRGLRGGGGILRDLETGAAGRGIGGGGGGVLGRVLGGASKVGVMNVEAGVVNVTGAAGAGGVSGSAGRAAEEAAAAAGASSFWSRILGRGKSLGRLAGDFAPGLVGGVAAAGGIDNMLRHAGPGVPNKVLAGAAGSFGFGAEPGELNPGGLNHSGSVNINGKLYAEFGKGTSAQLDADIKRYAAAKSASEGLAAAQANVVRAFKQVGNAAALSSVGVGHVDLANKGLRASVSGVRDSLSAYIAKLHAHNQLTPETVSRIQSSERALEGQLTQWTGNKQAADRLLATYHLLPRQIHTLIRQTGAQQVINVAARVQAALDRLHSKDIVLRTTTIDTTRKIAQLPGGADGGLIRGPGGPREDAIHALVSNGEFIVNAAATSRHLPLLMHLNAQRYAAGGIVGGGSSGSLVDLRRAVAEVVAAIEAAIAPNVTVNRSARSAYVSARSSAVTKQHTADVAAAHLAEVQEHYDELTKQVNQLGLAHTKATAASRAHAAALQDAARKASEAARAMPSATAAEKAAKTAAAAHAKALRDEASAAGSSSSALSRRASVQKAGLEAELRATRETLTQAKLVARTTAAAAKDATRAAADAAKQLVADVGNDFQTLQTQVTDFTSSVKTGLTGDYSLGTLWGNLTAGGGHANVAGLQASASSVLGTVSEFSGDLNRLIREGAGRDLIGQLVAMGPAAGDQLASQLLAAGPSSVKQLQTTLGQINDLSTSAANQLAEGFYGAGASAMGQFIAGLMREYPDLRAAFQPLLSDVAGLFGGGWLSVDTTPAPVHGAGGHGKGHRGRAGAKAGSGPRPHFGGHPRQVASLRSLQTRRTSLSHQEATYLAAHGHANQQVVAELRHVRAEVAAMRKTMGRDVGTAMGEVLHDATGKANRRNRQQVAGPR